MPWSTACRFQGASGQFIVLRPATALGETPVFLATMFRYAAFVGNDAWLQRHWQVVRNGISWMDDIHRHTYDEPGAPYAGLMPPGFVDGGISHKTADYGTVWWVLVALEQAIDAAQRLGYSRDAAHWTDIPQQHDRTCQTCDPPRHEDGRPRPRVSPRRHR